LYACGGADQSQVCAPCCIWDSGSQPSGTERDKGGLTGISHSRIELPHGSLPKQSIPNVQVVMLNSCDLSSDDLVPLSHLLPDLVRLDIPNNPRVSTRHGLGATVRISAHEAPVTGSESRALANVWRGLKYLNIATTGVAEWEDVLPVSELCPSYVTSIPANSCRYPSALSAWRFTVAITDDDQPKRARDSS
jgi:hypothetical protein